MRNSLKKITVLLSSVSVVAMLGGCAGGVDPFNPYPRGQGGYVDPPAAPLASQNPAGQPSPYQYQGGGGWRWNGNSWVRDGAIAGLGVAGGMIANRALSGGAAAALGEGAATGTATGEAVGAEALTAGRALSAARAGALAAEAAEAAETVEIIEIIEGLLLM